MINPNKYKVIPPSLQGLFAPPLLIRASCLFAFVRSLDPDPDAVVGERRSVFPTDELYRRRARLTSRADKTRGALSRRRCHAFYRHVTREVTMARHQSSGDYAVLARRRDLSITIRARSIVPNRRAIK